MPRSSWRRHKQQKKDLCLENSDRLRLNVGHVRERLLEVQLIALVDDLVLHINSAGRESAGRVSGAGWYGGGKEG